MALNDALVDKNRDPESSRDPAVAKLQSRWKSAVNKASTQLDAEAAHLGSDMSAARESSGAISFEMHLSEAAKVTLSPIKIRDNSASAGGWHAVRPSQVRKVDRRLARLQQAWLVPPISGCFHLNDQLVEWQLSAPQAIVNPVVTRIGYEPTTVDENAEPVSPDPTIAFISAESEVTETVGFSIAVAAESFLLNWIPTPWKMLSIDAQNVLSQIAITPLVNAVGLALGEPWHVVGLEARQEHGEGGRGAAHAISASPLIAPKSFGLPAAASVVSVREPANVLIGLNFRCFGVFQKDTATLSVPEEWLENFLATRREAIQFDLMKRVLTAHPGMADLLHTLPVLVGELVLNASEVEQLEIGDVLFFTTHRGPLESFWNSSSVKACINAPSANIELTLDGDKHTAQVRKISPRQFVGYAYDFVGAGASGSPHFSYAIEAHEALMQNLQSSNTGAADERSLSDHLATLPVAITIEVGELSMPLSALSDITIGTTLSLAKPLDEHLLTIRANGHAIAFGELVMLDGEVGVRVKRLNARAAPLLDRTSVSMRGESSSTPESESPAAAAPTESY